MSQRLRHLKRMFVRLLQVLLLNEFGRGSNFLELPVGTPIWFELLGIARSGVQIPFSEALHFRFYDIVLVLHAVWV
jgi:hypothetical protein